MAAAEGIYLRLTFLNLGKASRLLAKARRYYEIADLRLKPEAIQRHFYCGLCGLATLREFPCVYFFAHLIYDFTTQRNEDARKVV